ncbi:tetraacyldisaccharide 4'-kinase [Alloacidobacterium sp.]|uniref:tetraacyldisaccharide 4'-kinase n=1 Tax=Alloacidobacterium sp. TaxID=2951999 RepID=UPI002D4E993C|nr:tetraacyldisaccharide 4'-kinase [Alloacidobacterium sp.]HYK34950.1 tetraacyldisaccharide 4'-kinase [Alloacidobacterium sp.]
MIPRALWPLTSLYATLVATKNAVYDRGLAKAQQLRWPVISVGNISVGGSGKTPFAIALAKLLKQQGALVDVLSRGYGRRSSVVECVDPAGSAERFGDEPLLIAQSADVPVYVGASRYAAGLLAERDQPGAGIHLLDDGFQHRKLARAMDIVLLHRSDFDESLLPAGRLRESLNSLKRASVLVLRKEDSNVEERLRGLGIDKPIWPIKRSIMVPSSLGKAVAFCGIAHPDEFFAMLKLQGVEVIAMHAFRDHHRYSDDDVQFLMQQAEKHSASAFLTTEKDLVRLSPAQREKFSSLAAFDAVRLKVQLCDEAAAMRHLELLLPAGFKRLL